MKLLRLRLENFRQHVDSDIVFRDGMTAIVGANGSGKTTILEAIAGRYPKGETRPDYRKLRKNRPRRFRVGWPKDYFFEHVDGEVRRLVEAAAKRFKSLGARVEEV